MTRTLTGDSSICLRSKRPRVSLGVARPLLRARTVARVRARITQGRATTGRPLRGGYLMSAVSVFVGVDVAKDDLVVASRPGDETWTVANDESGVQEVLRRLRSQRPTLVVVEATGGYERDVVAVLARAGVPLVVANPRQVRDFARSTGQLAKTDHIDARILALFAERVRPEPRPLPDE